MGQGELRPLELARSISDGASIDWSEEETNARHSGGEALIQTLQKIARIAEVHRTFQDPAGAFDPRPRPTTGPQAWSHLEILECLGTGAFGEVYRAHDKRVGRDVALKLLLDGRASPETSNSGIIEEAHLLAKVRHPNVATVYGADECDGRIGIWMEYVEGQTLETKLREDGPVPVAEAVRIGIEVCDALSAVHAGDVLHRDVKAQNIVVEKEGRTVLVDFGVGEDQAKPERVRATGIPGTPFYLAPEVFQGQPHTVQTDLYSTGVLLFRLTTNAFPVFGETLDELKHAHETGSVRHLRSLRPDLPAPFVKIVERALAPDPSRRYETAEEMLRALKALNRPRGTQRSLKLTLAALVLVSTAVVAFFPRISPPPIRAGTRVVLANIENQTGDSQLDAVESLLETELRQSSYIEVMDRSTVSFVLERMVVQGEPKDLDLETSRELAWREGAPVVVAGTLLQVGSTFSLSMRVDLVGKDAPGAERTWVEDFRAANRDGLYEAVDAAATWVRETVGEQADDLRERDLPVREMTTPSWEALDAFYRAERFKAQDKWDEARLLFKEATELDPEFAMAYMRLGDLLSSQMNRDAYAYWEKAIDAMETRRVSKREEFNIRALYAADTGDYADSERLYHAFSLFYPNDVRALTAHGITLRTIGREEEALLRFSEAERRAPSDSIYLPMQVAGTYLALEDFAGVEAYEERLRQIDQHGRADAVVGAAHFVKGNYEEAEAYFRGLTQSPDLNMQSRGDELLAFALSELGRLGEAAEVLTESIRKDVDRDLAQNQADKFLMLGQIYRLQGKTSDSRRACLRALEIEPGPFQLMTAGVLLARQGFTHDAALTLNELQPDADKPLFEYAAKRVAGEISLVVGDVDSALEAFQAAAALDRPIQPKDYLARVLRRAGNREEAFEIYRSILDSSGRVWFQRVSERPIAPGFWAESLLEHADLAVSLGKWQEAGNSINLFVQLQERANHPSTDAARILALLDGI